jgi:hypothetical protein
LRATSISDYDGLVAVIRVRMAELSVTYETVDFVSGLPKGYAQKILGKTPVKHFGPISLGCILGALGLRLSVMPDPAALAKVERRLRARQLRHAVSHRGRSSRPGAAADSISTPPAI